MTAPSTTEPMSAEQSAALAEFARTCKAAARSVSLYPATHPAIQAALGRVVRASSQITAAGDVTVSVLPDLLVIEGRAPVRPDPAIGEFAGLLHDRLVGALRIAHEADAGDWRALLLILARTTEELMADGGIAKAWAATGLAHFEIREIDYAEVLRERAGTDGAAWDRIIQFCLHGDAGGAIDERAIEAAIGTFDNADRFGELIERIQSAPAGGATIGERAAALLGLIQKAIDTLKERRQGDQSRALQTIADAAAHMTPEMMLSFVRHARQPSATSDQPLAAAIVDQMGDGPIATFVAGSVVAERGATARLAQAFEALVPEIDRKERLLGLARSAAEQTPLGNEPGFDNLWQGAANMLTSYSDESFVSQEYGRELTGARTQAIDVERVSDDPPERVQTWLATVADAAVRDLDLALILDLLRIEGDPGAWRAVASVAADEVERRTLLGDAATAQVLLDMLVRERGDEGRGPLRAAAESTLNTLAGGPIIRHVVFHLRQAEDAQVGPLTGLCHTIGPSVVRPLALALAVEENNRAIGHLRELLLGFGAAGRQSVEQLKNSSNPAVRRTAIDLLRVFGGREALPELASMLDDADPQVQRESIRAIVQIGTHEAFAVLEHALVGGHASDVILQQLIGLRDDKAIPLLCHVLQHTLPRGRLAPVHLQIVEALGNLNAQTDSMRTLRAVLWRGEWWAPFRTAARRGAAAGALRRLGSPEALAVLREAAARGSRGVRNAAKRHVPPVRTDPS